MATLDEVRTAKVAFAKWLEAHPNSDVNGYGIGKADDGNYFLAVYLRSGAGRRRLPISFHNITVRFEVVGEIRPQGADTPPETATPDDPPPVRHRLPARPKQAPRREFILDRMPRHRFIVIELHLKRNRGGIRPGAVDAVKRFAKANVLQVRDIDNKTGIAYLSGTPSTLQWAFSPQDSRRNTIGKPIRMYVVRVNDLPYRTVDGKPSLPDYLTPHVKYIGGFDTRPGARLLVPARPQAPAAPKAPAESKPEASVAL